ncbi:hypothetical protein SAMD00019534_087530 [Acytostelium subglobosum LB1]|uniref:hypothetical protein n=1 Tax=Acytostelium subglobosum LB1 TaxID=1410327 RepID=UPI000644DA2A|nr:hypothetical protein SAMD00019534_087530 [Acytostelium subglobosum LB1]GAM25578.1 hypothetical protein SAMD00019534_087530 [Acytostelium subglobosum LB1]|eukprot:XP_012751564.1 hypothetical protein SAMD00019534_087530 [Acytostelium subglobosum LB1]
MASGSLMVDQTRTSYDTSHESSPRAINSPASSPMGAGESSTPPAASFITASPSRDSLFNQQFKTRDCSIVVKVFEARGLLEARLRKKEQTKNNNNKSFKRAQSLLTEISSPNLMQFSDTTDPYCVVQLDKQRHRTRTIPKKLNPFWCEEFTMEAQDPNADKMTVSIIDEKKYSNDEVIGKIVIPINILKDQKERELWFPLQAPNCTKKVPQLQIRVDFKPISLTDPTTPGHIKWKVLFGKNISSHSTTPINGSTNGADLGAPFINWSVRSKKGGIIVEEEGVSWQKASTTGVEQVLSEAIDCINFIVWRNEPKTEAPNNSAAALSPQSRSRSSTNIHELAKLTPDNKSRSFSSASKSPPLPSFKSSFPPPATLQASSTSGGSSSGSMMTSSGSSESQGSALLTSSTDSTGASQAPAGWEPVVLGMGSIIASHIDTEKPSDVWICLYPNQTVENRLGDVRLKLKYSEEVVLPLKSYGPLLEFIQDDEMSVINILGNISKQRETIANILIRVFEKTDRCADLLRRLTEQEIDSTDNPDIIFRGNSLATKSVDLYMKLIGLPYLASTIGPLIKKIYVSKKSCEIDPTKLEKGEDIKKNCRNLLSFVKKMASAIMGSAERCPEPLRQVFRAIQTKVRQRYPSDEVTRYTAVSGFIFLRFFCPSILAPKLFELMPDHPGMKTTRTLILIAKTLQNLANLVEVSDCKEDFMKDMNRFLVDNMDNMKTFIDSLASPVAATSVGDQHNTLARAELVNPISLEKELACLYRQLIKQKEDMWEDVNTGNNPQHLETMQDLEGILAKLEQEVNEAILM